MSELDIATATGIASGLATFWSMEASSWVKSFFTDHHPTAIAKAQQNTSDFLIELSNRVTQLENKKLDSKEVLEDPDFSAALQKAVLASAQTENKEKHQLLAEILAQRLTTESETILALTSKMAVDVIANLTPKQLDILSLYFLLSEIQLNKPMPSQEFSNYLNGQLLYYYNLEINEIDLLHLVSLACLTRVTFLTVDLDSLLSRINCDNPVDPNFYQDFMGEALINKFWRRRLENVQFTSVGLLLGMTAFNIKHKSNVKVPFFK